MRKSKFTNIEYGKLLRLYNMDGILKDYNTAKDIYSAFQRLINENESPAIIIADLLNNNDMNDELN